MKYVMLETTVGSVRKLTPVIFPEFVNHSDVAEFMVQILSKYGLPSQVRSAGEIDVLASRVGGESTTLNVCSSDEDTSTINGYDYFHGIVS